ncbi:MAG: vWA domain-containing protein [Planctomycetota bacterium]
MVALTDPLTLGTLLAVAVGLIVAVGEVLHRRRTARVRYLAFGPTGRPAPWVNATHALRVGALAITAFGLAVLLVVEPNTIEVEPDPEASKHVLVCIDASPSMFVADAGPDPRDLQSRTVRGGEVVQAILDRLDPKKTRVTVVGVYTEAIPVAIETFDKQAVRNFFDGVPMYAAFEPGPTLLRAGVNEAMKLAYDWPADSALLLVVSDGDSGGGRAVTRPPPAIADAIVVGVGDARRATTVSGHRSRQDARSLRELASRLGGIYFDANTRHLPSAVLSRVEMTTPDAAGAFGWREVGVAFVVAGTTTLAALTPLLVAFGRPRARVVLDRPVPIVRAVRGGAV